MKRLLLILTMALALCASARAQKLSALPSGTPTTTDAVPYVADPAGTPVTKKTTVADLFGALTPFQLQTSNKHGDGTQFQLFSGSSSANDCAKFDLTGNIVSTGGTCSAAAPVQSVFGRTGSVAALEGDYNTGQVTESGNLYYTNARARAAFTFNSPLSLNTTTGVASIQQADATHDGVLPSADWNTFNGKQAALGFTPENAANKDAASGYAGLDASSLLKAAEFPAFGGDVSKPAGSLTFTVTKLNGNTPGGVCTNQFVRSLSSSAVPTCASVDNSSLVNSSITANAGTNFGMTLPGAMSLGSTYTFGATSDNLRFNGLGLGVAAPTSGGQIAATGGVNNITLLTLKRFTDTSPTGNFIDFQNAAGSHLWQVDIAGQLLAGTVPIARVSGAAASATTDTTDAGNISTGTLDKNRVPSTLNATTAPSLTVSGTAGTGFAEFGAQSSNPSAPSSGFRLFADSGGKLSWRRASDGFTRSFDATLTADRTYTLPDRSATVATTTGTLTSGNCAKFDASGNVVDFGAGCASAPYMPAFARVTGSNATTTSTSLTDITGLSVALSANTTYEVDVWLSVNSSADANGMQYALQYSVAGATIEAGLIGTFSGTAVRTDRLSAFNTASGNRYMQASSIDGEIIIRGTVTTGANAGNLTAQHLKATSGTSTVRIGSYIKVTKIQ